MSEIRISDEAKSCADKIIANFISSGASASTAFIAAQAIEELLNQRDAELAELRKEILEMDSLIRTIGSRCDLYLVRKHGQQEAEKAMTASQAGAKGGEK